MKKAIFWDRDGVVNEVSVVSNKAMSPRKLEDFKLTQGIRDHFKKTKEFGYQNIIVTNQPDISRGLITQEVLNEMHAFLEKELRVDEINFCPHDNMNRCGCRKPEPGLITSSAQKNNIDLNKSYIIGDTIRDVMAGKSAGLRTILLRREYNTDAHDLADYVIDSIEEMFNFIS